MNPAELKSAIEAIIYVADEPATVDQIARALGAGKDEVRAAITELLAGYQTDERGIEIRKVASGYKFYTKPQHHDSLRRFIKSLRPPLRLTMPALETLAVIAYRQPTSRAEIEAIRGVHCGEILRQLMERDLIRIASRSEDLGRPFLYGTTKRFLRVFGLRHLDELPRADVLRAGPPFAGGRPGLNRSQFYADFNASKLGVGIDLEQAVSKG